tara:strand:- start:65 stop:541 length:477 start_codon:yes stop_codon:yes gene_type:complete
MEVIGYPDYLIYNDGRVWSKKRQGAKGGFLKQQVNIDGYKTISIKRSTKHMVHRLIAIHYIPNPENKPEVDHINRDPSDNRAENLRWVSHQENMDNQTSRPQKNNTSGHKNIHYSKNNNKWIFNKSYHGFKKEKCFKTKTDAICYKFIYLLKIKFDLF